MSHVSLNMVNSLPEAMDLLSAFHVTSFGVAVLDQGGVVQYANPSLSKMAAHRLDELLGRRLDRLFQSDSFLEYVSYTQSDPPSEGTPFESEMTCGDGTRVSVSIECSKLTEDWTLVFVREVSRERMLVRETGARNAWFESLCSSDVFGFVSFRLDGEIVEANEAFLNMLGFARAELEARTINWKRHTPVDWHEQDRQFLKEMIETRRTVSYYKELLTRDGSRVPVYLGAHLVGDRDERRVTAVLRDMTEVFEARIGVEEPRAGADLTLDAREVEPKLFDNEERFRTLAEAIPQIVYIVDSKGRIDYLNRRWFEYTGHSDELSMGLSSLRAIHPDDFQRTKDVWLKCLREGSPFESECRLCSSAGEYRWFILRALPVRDHRGHVSRWFGTGTDINDQKRVAEEMRVARDVAEHADRMKSSFLANMSHEIRTPLGAILGFTELLAEDALSEEERNEFLQIIARNGRTLSRIVDDILDLSKVEAGVLQIDRQLVSPTDLVADAVALFTERARSKGLWLDFKVREPAPLRVETDPYRLRQILANLISNALKFTDRGGVSVEICTESKSDGALSGKNWLTIIVRDTGIGITKAQMSQLFKPFSQVDDSMSRRFGGTGLGLHLSRRLAEALGGELEVLSTEFGHGSTFSLRLPYREESDRGMSPLGLMSDKETKSDADSLASFDRSLCGRKVLVVEDSRDNQLLIERLLGKKGAELKFAPNGQCGVEAATNEEFDLILMDLQMPDMDGFEATEKLRRLGIQVPIVALTAHVVEDVRKKCATIGCDGFLAKPIHAPDLLKVVREMTETRIEVG